MRLNAIDWAALVLVIIGALNWLLVAFGFNLVSFLFAGVPGLEGLIYLLVGLSGLWLIYLAYRLVNSRNVRLNIIDWIALVLAIIGALNWLLVLFGANLVNAIFGAPPALGSVITYILVGLSGLWLIVLAFRLRAMGTTAV